MIMNELSALRGEITTHREGWATFKEEWVTNNLLHSQQEVAVQDEMIEEEKLDGGGSKNSVAER